MAKENFDHLKVLAGQGNAEAQFQLGEYYFEQRSEAETEEDEDKVSAECLKWYTKAAEQGHAVAQRYLGEFHETGICAEEDDKEALKWYRLAELLTVHRVTLCREFKKAFRISPGAYLKGCRLRKAVEMLSQHRYTIKEIAFSCGFSSQEYFATVFHSEFGHTPSTF